MFSLIINKLGLIIKNDDPNDLKIGSDVLSYFFFLSALFFSFFNIFFLQAFTSLALINTV